MAETGDIAGVLLPRDGSYFLVEQNRPDIKGLWNLPGGHQNPGETLVETALREMREETGWKGEITNERPICISPARSKLGRVYVFVGKIIGGSFSLQTDELSRADWLTLDQVRRLDEIGRTRHPAVLKSILTFEGIHHENFGH